MTPSKRGDQRRIDRDAEHWFGRMHARSSAEESAAFEQWYQEDKAHRQAYDGLLADYDEFGLLALTETGRRRRLSRAAVWQRRPVATAAAAGLGALAILAAVGLSLRDNPARHAAASNTIIAASETPRTLVLDDGSLVTLAAGARMTSFFSTTRRDLRLDSGKARFRVAHGDPRPFVVAAAGGRIIAHGTVFEVDRRANRVHVSLLQGSISIVRPASGGQPIRRQLLPGQQLDYPASDTARTAAMVDQTSTEAEMVMFAATRLDEATRAIGAASRRRIVLDPALGGLRISGAFRRGDVEGFAAAISAMFRCRRRPLADGGIAIDGPPLG